MSRHVPLSRLPLTAASRVCLLGGSNRSNQLRYEKVKAAPRKNQERRGLFGRMGVR